MCYLKGVQTETKIMKTVGVRALRENPGVLSKSAGNGECVLLTNRSKPISISVPFDDKLLEVGVNVDIALKLFEDRVVTLVKGAQIAGLSVEDFLLRLQTLNIVVVEQSQEDLEEDLATLDE